jgi:flavin reductase (DIM6/NTAB) family NADH-FMN oxidoreductase RutF
MRMNMTFFDLEQLDQRRCYNLLASTVVPRPIAWVVTCDAQGRPNAAPYSFFNFFSGYPPVICVGMSLQEGQAKDSLANIRASGEFIVNMVPASMAEAMNTTAVPFPRGVNELEKAHLTTRASVKVRPPHIEGSPVALECRLKQIVPVDTSATIVVAHVAAMHVREDAVLSAERGHIDGTRLDIIGRMESPSNYTRTTERFSMPQRQVEEWERLNPAR